MGDFRRHSGFCRLPRLNAGCRGGLHCDTTRNKAWRPRLAREASNLKYPKCGRRYRQVRKQHVPVKGVSEMEGRMWGPGHAIGSPGRRENRRPRISPRRLKDFDGRSVRAASNNCGCLFVGASTKPVPANEQSWQQLTILSPSSPSGG